MKHNIKKIMKRIGIILITVIILFILNIGLFLLFVPISRPDEAVHKYVLRKIPIGTTWNDAAEIIDDKGWEIRQTSTEHGLWINSSKRGGFASDDEMKYGTENSNIRIVGVKSMWVELGEYYGPFHTAVSVYLAFDENNKLIEAVVRRDIDGL